MLWPCLPSMTIFATMAFMKAPAKAFRPLASHICRRRSALATSTCSAAKDEIITTVAEEALSELESEALYGLGSKQSSLRDFVAMLEEGQLNLFPKYQRSYVWQPNKASRLIATALCNRFIPAVVLHEVSKGVFDVVDGKQRLTSLLGFYLNSETASLPKDPIRSKLQAFLPQLAKLSKLEESYEVLNNISFDDLTEERQKAFKSYTISYMVIPRNTPKTDVFEVYEDINSGGEDLTAQQVRRAVYHGPYMAMIDDLKENCSDFQAIRKPQAFKSTEYKVCSKDSDGELILRAFAFRRNGDKFKPSLKKFLNRELDGSADADGILEADRQRISIMVEELKQEFKSVMKIAREVFGDDAFRKKNANSKKGADPAISNTLWDAKYCAIAELMSTYKELDFTRSKDEIATGWEQSLESGFFSTDDNKTSASKFDQRKYELKTILRNAIASSASGNRDSKRTFPKQWKQRLFDDQHGICAICGQSMDRDRLEETNYVHIDHKKPHIKGGLTTYDNAQLAHSICNRSKGAKMV